MKKLFALLVLVGSQGWAAGGASPLTVSSGTFLPVSLYNNADGANRQAIILGDRVSSATAIVDPLNGLAVYVTTGSSPLVVITTGVASQPVTGTFFQTIQPVVLTSTPPIQVFGSTIAITNVSGQNLNVAGTLSVTSLSTGAINTPTPQVANFNGYVSPSGTVQSAAVTLSSQAIVYVANPSTVTVTGIVPVVLTSTPPIQVFGSTLAVSGVQGIVQTVITSTPPIQVFGTTIAVTNVSGQNLNVAGSLTVVSLSTGQINTPVPQVTTYNGFISPTGTVQAAAVTLTSQTIVYVANPATVTVTGTVPVVLTSTPPIQIFGSTIALSGIQGIVQTVITSTPPVQIFGSTIALSGIQGIVQTVITSTPPIQVFGSTLTVANIQTAIAIGSTPTVTVILSTITSVGMYADNGIATTTNRVNVNPGVYNESYRNGVVGTEGKDAALEVGTDGMLHTAILPSISGDSYAASTNTFSIASSTNDAAAFCGNAKDTVVLTSIRASCTQTTAGIIQIGIVKRSSAYSGVWSTMTVVSESSNYVATNSTATFFTSANLVVGTLVGYLDSYKLGCMAAGTATPNDMYISPADWRSKPIVLNSASECVAINLNGATISGGTMSATFDYMETPTINP